MKAYGGMEVYFYTRLILALNVGVYPQTTGALPNGEEGPPVTIWQAAEWLREPDWTP